MLNVNSTFRGLWSGAFFLWNCPQVNATRPHWLLVNIIGSGNRSAPSGNKLLHGPMLTKFFDAILRFFMPRWVNWNSRHWNINKIADIFECIFMKLERRSSSLTPVSLRFAHKCSISHETSLYLGNVMVLNRQEVITQSITIQSIDACPSPGINVPGFVASSLIHETSVQWYDVFQADGQYLGWF